MGPETDIEDLTYSDWCVTVIPEDTVLDCANSHLILSDVTVEGIVRTEDQTTYNVLEAGNEPVTMSIPSRKVVPTTAGCPVETKVEYETHGEWRELKSNDYV
jgi:hypothetical protein